MKIYTTYIDILPMQKNYDVLQKYLKNYLIVQILFKKSNILKYN